MLTPGQSLGGYLQATVYRPGKNWRVTVHSLVMNAFIGPRPPEMHIAHADHNKHNNHLSNLRYATVAENVQDSIDGDRFARGERTHKSALTADDVSEIRRRAAAGENQRALAREHGVSQAAISLIVRRVNWKHVA